MRSLFIGRRRCTAARLDWLADCVFLFTYKFGTELFLHQVTQPQQDNAGPRKVKERTLIPWVPYHDEIIVLFFFKLST